MTDRPGLGRRALAEMIGTGALVFAGCGAIVTDAERDGALGVVGVGLVFLLVLLAVIASLGHVSGAHFNPAVYLAGPLAGAPVGALAYQFLRGEHPGVGAPEPTADGSADVRPPALRGADGSGA